MRIDLCISRLFSELNGIGNHLKLNGTNGTEPGGFNRNALWRMQLDSKSVIHMITENGALQLMMEQLDHLPFILHPGSVRPVTGGNVPLHLHQTHSLCNSCIPTHIAELESVYVPTRISKESKKLLISLPIFILKLFPRDFFNLLMRERESIPDEPLLTLRQKLNRGMLLGLILFPDSSVLKSKVLPNCLKRPRYIYSPPNATGKFFCS